MPSAPAVAHADHIGDAKFFGQLADIGEVAATVVVIGVDKGDLVEAVAFRIGQQLLEFREMPGTHREGIAIERHTQLRCAAHASDQRNLQFCCDLELGNARPALDAAEQHVGLVFLNQPLRICTGTLGITTVIERFQHDPVLAKCIFVAADEEFDPRLYGLAMLCRAPAEVDALTDDELVCDGGNTREHGTQHYKKLFHRATPEWTAIDCKLQGI